MRPRFPVRKKYPKTNKNATNAELCKVFIDLDKKAHKEADDAGVGFKNPLGIRDNDYDTLIKFCEYVNEGATPDERQSRFYNNINDAATRAYYKAKS